MGKRIHRFKGWLNCVNSDDKMEHVFTSQHNYGLAGVFQNEEQRPKTRQDANDFWPQALPAVTHFQKL